MRVNVASDTVNACDIFGVEGAACMRHPSIKDLERGKWPREKEMEVNSYFFSRTAVREMKYENGSEQQTTEEIYAVSAFAPATVVAIATYGTSRSPSAKNADFIFGSTICISCMGLNCYAPYETVLQRSFTFSIAYVYAATKPNGFAS